MYLVYCGMVLVVSSLITGHNRMTHSRALLHLFFLVRLFLNFVAIRPSPSLPFHVGIFRSTLSQTNAIVCSAGAFLHTLLLSVLPYPSASHVDISLNPLSSFTQSLNGGAWVPAPERETLRLTQANTC